MSQKHELWAVALWVEKEHGDRWWAYIHKRQEKLLEDGDPDGVLFWNGVIELCLKLRPREAKPLQ